MAEAKGPRIKTRIGKKKSEFPPTQDEILWRGIRSFLVLLNPLTAAFYYTLLPLYMWQRVIRAVWLLAASIVFLVAALFMGAGPAYLAPYVGLAGAVVEAAKTNIVTLGPALLSTVEANWWGWLVGQLPLAFGVSSVAVSIYATWRSRYQADHREKEENADDKAVKVAVKKIEQWPQSPKTVKSLADLKIRIGVDRRTGQAFDVPALSFGMHFYLDGPSGYGKTTDLIEICRGFVEAPAAQQFRMPLFFLTMKPDEELTNAFRAIARNANRNFHLITEDGQGSTTTYNPIRHGTAEQARNVLVQAEKLADGRGFDNAHYLSGGERLALLAIRVIDELAAKGITYKRGKSLYKWKRDINHVARMMMLDTLRANKDLVSDTLAASIEEYLAEVDFDPDIAKGGSGMRGRFVRVAEGASGKVMQERADGLDIRQAIRDGDVVLFNLDAAADQNAAQQLGNLAIQDLTASMAALGKEGWNKENGKRTRMGLTIVDEFSALGGELLKNVFQRARSHGFGAGLATQESGALEEVSPAFKQAILQSSNIKILHKQEINAEEFAKMIGTESTMIETFQTFEDKDLLGEIVQASGQGNIREGETFKVHPNELRELGQGQTVFLVGIPRGNYRVQVRMSFPPNMDQAAAEAAAVKPLPEPETDGEVQPPAQAKPTGDGKPKPRASFGALKNGKPKVKTPEPEATADLPEAQEKEKAPATVPATNPFLDLKPTPPPKETTTEDDW